MKLALILAAAGTILFAGGACAMTNHSASGRCSVTGGELLAPSFGDEAALCRSFAPILENPRLQSVEVSITSASRAEAMVTMTDGRRLGPIHVASSDAALTPRSFTMLADAIAAKLNR